MQVILIATDSKVLLDDKIKEIIKDSKNVLSMNFYESGLVNILEEASYVSMFEDTKYLIIKNADFFGKEKLKDEDQESLLNYLRNPYPCTVLIFTTYETLDKRKSITKYIQENHSLVELKSPKNYDLFLDTKKALQKYKIEDQAVRYLVDSCLGNYDLIHNEIEKFSLMFKKNDSISLAQMKNIVAVNMNDNIFKFLDAVIQKDISLTFHLLEDLFVLKIDAIQIFSMLIREYRLMYYYKILEKKRISNTEIANKLKMKDWQVTKIMKNCSLYHKDDLKDYLLELASIDVKLKSGQYEKNAALYSFLFKVLE